MPIQGLDTAVGTITGSWGTFAKYSWLIWVILGCLIIGTIIFIIVYAIKSKQKWNLQFRIRQENRQHSTLYLDPTIIHGRRVTLSNGLRLIYLEKEVLGKRLFPNLNSYTRPGIYDLIITADNRIFLIDGISGIDEQRKELKVGIRYPGIDYSLEEVNRDHAKLNKLDRRSDLLGIVKAASIAVVAIVLLVAMIVGGKYWIEGKQIDSASKTAELELLQGLQDYQIVQLEQTKVQLEQTKAMTILTDKLKATVGESAFRQSIASTTITNGTG